MARNTTLLEDVATYAVKEGLAANYAEFSVAFCGKSANWYAYQKHKGRDFSLSALINCLAQFRSLTAKLGRFNTVWQTELLEIEQLEKKMSEQLARSLGTNVRVVFEK